MKIEIDTNNMSDTDVAVLNALAGLLGTDEVEDAPVAPPAPAPKPAPAKKAAAAPKPAPEPVVEPEPAPEPEEDLVGGATFTIGDAVAKATALVSDGESKKVKAALVAVGAPKVGELKPEQVPAFMAALDA